MIAEVGGANVEYNANLTSKRHTAQRQQDLTLVIKWEPVLPLVQAVRENTKRGALLHGVPYGVPKMEYP